MSLITRAIVLVKFKSVFKKICILMDKILVEVPEKYKMRSLGGKKY